MPPSRSLPPVECCRGTSPIHAAKSRPDLKSLVCDSRSNGRGPDHANPGHGFEAAAHVIGTTIGVNGAVQSPDLQFQSSELIDNGLQRLFHRRWKSFAVTFVRDDRGKLRETFAPRLRNEAELGKVGPERIDQLRARVTELGETSRAQ
jgi:hypothetical protein